MINIKQSNDCDVLIAGAGPAGATAAYYLAKAGYNVWIVDKQRFPRDKVCGDFVSPVGLVELLKMGVTREISFQQTNIIDQASLILDGVTLVTAPIPPVSGLPPFGRVIPRILLDDWILNAARRAGASVIEGCRVIDFQNSNDGVLVTSDDGKHKRKIRTRLLIGADGANSVVARSLRDNTISDKNRIVAIRAYFEDVECLSNCAELYFNADSFPGYCWLFPTGDGLANVGVGILAETIPQSKHGLKILLQQLIKEDRTLHQRLKNSHLLTKVNGWPLPTYDHRLPIVSDRVMTVGDAAGLINPLNGEGIQYAMLSGRWAAETASQCLFHDQLGQQALSTYTKTVEQEMRYDMAISGIIVQLIRNRHFNPVWLRSLHIIGDAARYQPEYAAIAGGVLAGIIPASNLLGYRIVMGTIKQAALSLGIDTVYNSIANPADAIQNGINAIKISALIANGVLGNTADSAKWGVDLAKGTVELGKHIYNHQFR